MKWHVRAIGSTRASSGTCRLSVLGTMSTKTKTRARPRVLCTRRTEATASIASTAAQQRGGKSFGWSWRPLSRPQVFLRGRRANIVMGDSLVTPKEPVDPDEFEAVEATARPVYPGNVWEDTPYGEFADRCTKAAFIGILVDLDKAERAEEEWRTVETEDLVTPYR